MNPSFEAVIRILLEVRESQHGDANVSVRLEIDKAVELLREVQDGKRGDDEETKRMAFYAVGQALRALPTIQRLISQFLE